MCCFFVSFRHDEDCSGSDRLGLESWLLGYQFRASYFTPFFWRQVVTMAQADHELNIDLLPLFP